MGMTLSIVRQKAHLGVANLLASELPAPLK